VSVNRRVKVTAAYSKRKHLIQCRGEIWKTRFDVFLPECIAALYIDDGRYEIFCFLLEGFPTELV
jgi:hypothetical protein